LGKCSNRPFNYFRQKGLIVNQEIYEWILLLARWLHITVGVTWIGTSIFFMWLDRTLTPNPNSKNAGHVGDLWMVHGVAFITLKNF